MRRAAGSSSNVLPRVPLGARKTGEIGVDTEFAASAEANA